MLTLIDATTEAVTTEPFTVVHPNSATLVANGLDGVEEITIQAEYSDGDFCDIYYTINGDKAVLSATGNFFCIAAPNRYRLVKGETAGAVTVGMSKLI